MTEQLQCPRCQGQGVIKKWPGDRSPDRDCAECDGTGVRTKEQVDAYFERQRS